MLDEPLLGAVRFACAVFVLVAATGCTADAPAEAHEAGNPNDPFVACGTRLGEPCDTASFHNHVCMCDYGTSYPIGRNVCCIDGVIYATWCSEWNTGCPGGDSGAIDAADSGTMDIGRDAERLDGARD